MTQVRAAAWWLGLASFLAAPLARAQAEDPQAESHYEVTVTALRLVRPLPEVPSTVTVVPRAEIDRVPALGADELVRTDPSAGTFRRTPALVADPSSQGLNLRGVGPSAVSRALLLIDGFPVNDPFGGWIYWRALPRLGIDRIEIVPGGASALYGNYAMGGTVQVVSRPLADEAAADLAFGSLDTRDLALHAAHAGQRWGVALDAEALSSDGYVVVAPDERGPIDRPAASRHGAAVARLEASAGGWSVNGRIAVFDEQQNGGTEFTTAAARTGSAALALERPLRGGQLRLALWGGLERFDQDRARVETGRVSETLAATQTVPSNDQGASLVWTSAAIEARGTHTLVLGLDARRIEGRADETLYPTGSDPTSVVARRSGGEQRFLGAFAEELYAPRPSVELLAGARFDGWWNVDGQRDITTADGTASSQALPTRDETQLSPRIGMLLRPLPRTRLRGTAFSAFRAPTLNELYRPFQAGTVLTAANESLRAERLLGADLGVEQLYGEASAIRLTGFWNVLFDPIVNATLTTPLADGSTRQRQNLGRARIRGLELSGDLRLGRHFIASAAYTLADSRVIDGGGNAALVGMRLAQDPVHRVRAALTGLGRRGQATVQLRAQSSQFEDDLNTLPMGGFAVLDASADAHVYRFISVYADAQNLFDNRYLVGRSGVDTIGPPRIVMAGIRIRTGRAP
jgi:outer membrane receptor protein involved in Fe transport